FVLCAFVLMRPVVDAFRMYPRRVALGLLALIAGFLANVGFVATGRTALVVAPVLLLLFALRNFRWQGVFGVFLAGLIAGWALWVTSDYLQARVAQTVQGIGAY